MFNGEMRNRTTTIVPRTQIQMDAAGVGSNQSRFFGFDGLCIEDPSQWSQYFESLSTCHQLTLSFRPHIELFAGRSIADTIHSRHSQHILTATLQTRQRVRSQLCRQIQSHPLVRSDSPTATNTFSRRCAHPMLQHIALDRSAAIIRSIPADPDAIGGRKLNTDQRWLWRSHRNHSVHDAVFAKQVFRRARIVAGQCLLDHMDFQTTVGGHIVERTVRDRSIAREPARPRRWIPDGEARQRQTAAD